MKTLVIEDSRSTLKLLCTHIEKMRFTPIPAETGAVGIDLFLKEFLCDDVEVHGLETLIDGISAVAEVGVPRADGHADQRAVAGVIACHLIARDVHGEVRAAIDGGDVCDALA